MEGVPTIDLTRDGVEVCYPPHKGNITEDMEVNVEMPAAQPDTLAEQQTAHAGSSKARAPPGDEQHFSPQNMERLEALMSKENKALTLIKVRTEEALTCFDVPVSQDEASYDGDMSSAEEDDIEVVPDEVNDVQAESSKPVGAVSKTGKV